MEGQCCRILNMRDIIALGRRVFQFLPELEMSFSASIQAQEHLKFLIRKNARLFLRPGPVSDYH